jgi:ketosteroid isomerase-like protein
MSQENVEIVEQVIAAWNRRDLEAILSFTDPEAEYVNAPLAVEPGTRHGHAELSEVFRKQWEGLGADARQQIDRAYPGGEEVITAGRVSRRIPGSDTQIENRVAVRWTFRDGRVIRVEVLGGGSSFKEALKAAGLRE